MLEKYPGRSSQLWLFPGGRETLVGHPSHGCADSRNGGRGVEALWGVGRGDPQDGIAWLATRWWVESSRLIPGVLGGGWSVCNWGGEPTKGEQVVCVCVSVLLM